MSISSLQRMMGDLHLSHPAESIKNSCYPVISLDNGGAMTVSDNMGTYDHPILHVTIEVPKDGGFKELHVLLPGMEVISSEGFSEDEVGNLLFEICRNQYTCIEVSERGWDNA